jgi:ornithine cyclodeaminase
MIDEVSLTRALTLGDAIEALEAAFREPRWPDGPQRTHLEVNDGGELLLMPVWNDCSLGVKLVTLNPSNSERGMPFVHGVYILFGSSLEPEAIVDGTALTVLRTAAVSGLATRLLARPDAQSLVLFGAGVQAHAHLDAMLQVRPITRVDVVDPNPERALALVQKARAEGLEARTADAGAVSDADIVCTCTTSPVPVFDGQQLKDGAHVNAMGAYRPDKRELDEHTVRRGRLVVETRAAALAEAGDIIIPMQRGTLKPSDIRADLREVLLGTRVRENHWDVTVFKSVGVAFEDLVVATAALNRVEGKAAAR